MEASRVFASLGFFRSARVNLFKKKVQIAGIGEIEVDADPMEA